MSNALRLTEELISRESNTPLDAGCMDILLARLQPLGFVPHWLEFGEGDSGVNARVRNVWLKRLGSSPQAKTIVLAGHTDVVPTGPLDQWTTPPFVPSYRDGKLYGRGASDMKGSLAAFTVAVEELLAAQPDYAHHLAFLLTSDEEGPSINGTVKVCEWLKNQGETLDFCIVGEPTSVKAAGDMIKNGRRGTMSGKLTIRGIQGHIAYPQLARNPIHLLAPALAALVATEWDKGNAYFPPTSWQVSNIHAGTGASNVIPGDCVVDFNFRFCTESSPEGLQARVAQALQAVGLMHEKDYSLQWTIGGLPFLTPVGTLVDAVRQAILAETGISTELSTTGGTSDGRFIASICPQVIELGPTNATIHKIDEHVTASEIETIKNIYRRSLENLALGSANRI
jgi:succinyl-diaminopimelate desuccinylase